MNIHKKKKIVEHFKHFNTNNEFSKTNNNLDSLD